MTLKSHFASHYPSKRHSRGGLKTSISLGNICGLHLCKKALNSVQSPFSDVFKVSGLYVSNKLGPEGNTKNLF